MSATLTQAAVHPHHRARNTAWNLLGMCAPMVVALFAIPLLVEGMGKDRFGLLTLIWMLVGYLGVFDLGLGRALTQTVAQRLGEGRLIEVAGVFWHAIGIMSGLGALGGLVVWNMAPWLAHGLLNIEPALQSETVRSFRAVALGLPVLISVTGLVGTLEAFQKFKLVNVVRIPTGIFTFVGPLLVLPYSSRLSDVVLVLLLGRLAEWIFFFVCCLGNIPGAFSPIPHGQRNLGGLFRFGSWMTVTNLVSPLLMHVDRFLIGSLRTASDVAFFATPAEIVIKLLILPRAWISVLFPSFAGGYRQRPVETAELFSRSCRYLLFALFPIVAGVVTLAPEFLHLWLGEDFARGSAPVMRLLTIGVFLHSLAFVPMSLLQAAARPDYAAKLNLIELPLYVVVSSTLIYFFGIVGAGAAWLVRAGVDVYFGSRFALRLLDQPPDNLQRFKWIAVLDVLALALLSLPSPLWVRLLAGPALVLAHVVGCWRALLLEDDQRRLTGFYVSLRDRAQKVARQFMNSDPVPP
jgi:O-antigen/teichoic acid export membrane protein